MNGARTQYTIIDEKKRVSNKRNSRKKNLIEWRENTLTKTNRHWTFIYTEHVQMHIGQAKREHFSSVTTLTRSTRSWMLVEKLQNKKIFCFVCVRCENHYSAKRATLFLFCLPNVLRFCSLHIHTYRRPISYPDTPSLTHNLTVHRRSDAIAVHRQTG